MSLSIRQSVSLPVKRTLPHKILLVLQDNIFYHQTDLIWLPVDYIINDNANFINNLLKNIYFVE